jgi:hypothetical protein
MELEVLLFTIYLLHLLYFVLFSYITYPSLRTLEYPCFTFGQIHSTFRFC